MARGSIVVAAITIAAGSSFALAGGNMLDGNARFQIGASPSINSAAIPFNAPSGEGDLITDTGGTDYITRNLWYIRGGNQNTGLIFRLNTTAPSESYVGNVGTVTSNDHFISSTVSRPVDIVYRATLTDFGTPNTALVVQRMTITNRSALSVSFTLFNLLAPTLGGGSDVANDRVQFVGGDPTNQMFDETSGGRVVNFRGFGASRGQAGEARSTGIYSLFPTSGSGTTGTTNLSNAIQGGGSSFGGSIFGTAGVLQFNISLAPGASTDIYSAIGVNTAAIPAPGAAALLGLAGLVAGRRRR